MVQNMSAVAWYATIAGVLLPLSYVALQRMGWPAGIVKRLSTAAAVALAWPLALPVVSFGSVAIARLVQTHTPAPREAIATPVAPAA
jgi:hypothetical protein